MLGLGLGVYIAAWAFGSTPLYPVATGLLLVVGLAWVWVRLGERARRVGPGLGGGARTGRAGPAVAGATASTWRATPCRSPSSWMRPRVSRRPRRHSSSVSA